MPQRSHPSPLNTTQEQAVRHSGGPLLIAAGAGSGKTKTLTSRLLHLLETGVAPQAIIAITFTNKAAKEMRSRITNNELGITNGATDEKKSGVIHNSKFILPFIGTFHALGVRILKEEAHWVGRTSHFTIFDDEDSASLIKSILKELQLSKDRFSPYAVIGQISRIKNELINVDEYADEGRYEHTIATVYRKYNETLLHSNAFDFDDLIEKVVRIFLEHPEVLAKYRARWQYVLVDEFQDVNTNQYLFVKLLAQEHKNIFVIGDDAQSIYAFRGSDFRNFLNFEKDWPDAKVILLTENYRSTKNIINAASALIKHNSFQKPKDLWTSNPEGELINVMAFQNAEEEAVSVAQRVREALGGGESPKEIAVLYRTNAQSRALEQSLIRNNIPYEIYGGLKFYARKEIKDIVSAIRYAFNPKDRSAIDRITKTFNKGPRIALLEALPRLAEERLSLVELIQYFLEETRYTEFLALHFKNPDERLENIKELIQFAASFNDPHDFIEQVTLLSSLDGRPKLQENAVKLMTIHLSKGLEFDRVFIVGANEGLLPHERSMIKNDDLEEERRLMYVAITRARKHLTISFYDLPSRFLGELPPELIAFTKVSSYGAETRDWDDETIYLE
ncbi:UvrD-helicase domain-containing protein [Patescibacteria group bacterium]|nr:UvrD-helicase domain-containing protein [Patescibacteria group bacterium]